MKIPIFLKEKKVISSEKFTANTKYEVVEVTPPPLKYTEEKEQ